MLKTKTSKIWYYYSLQDFKTGKAISNKCKAVLSNVDGCTIGMDKHLCKCEHGINIQKIILQCQLQKMNLARKQLKQF